MKIFNAVVVTSLLFLISCASTQKQSKNPIDESSNKISVQKNVSNKKNTENKSNVETKKDAQESSVSKFKNGDRLALIRSFAFSPDDKLLAIGGDNLDKTINIIDSLSMEDVAIITQDDNPVYSMVFTKDNNFLIVAGNYISIWNIRKKQLVTKIKEYGNLLAMHPKGKTFATVDNNGNIFLLNTNSWKLSKKFSSGKASVSVLAYSKDGNFLVTGHNDGNILIWDSNSGKVIKTLSYSKDKIINLGFFNNNSIIASNVTGKIIIWDIKSGKKTFDFSKGLDFLSVRQLIVSPSGKYFYEADTGLTNKVTAYNTGKIFKNINFLSNEIPINYTFNGIGSISFNEHIAYKTNEGKYEIPLFKSNYNFSSKEFGIGSDGYVTCFSLNTKGNLLVVAKREIVKEGFLFNTYSFTKSKVFIFEVKEK